MKTVAQILDEATVTDERPRALRAIQGLLRKGYIGWLDGLGWVVLPEPAISTKPL